MHASGSLGPGGIQMTNLATHKRSSQNIVGRSSQKVGTISKKPQCQFEEKAEGGFIMRGMKPKQKSQFSHHASQLNVIGHVAQAEEVQISIGGRSSDGGSRGGHASRQEVISNTQGYSPHMSQAQSPKTGQSFHQ